MVLSPGNQNAFSSLEMLEQVVKMVTVNGRAPEVQPDRVMRKFAEVGRSVGQLGYSKKFQGLLSLTNRGSESSPPPADGLPSPASRFPGRLPGARSTSPWTRSWAAAGRSAPLRPSAKPARRSKGSTALPTSPRYKRPSAPRVPVPSHPHTRPPRGPSSSLLYPKRHACLDHMPASNT